MPHNNPETSKKRRKKTVIRQNGTVATKGEEEYQKKKSVRLNIKIYDVIKKCIVAWFNYQKTIQHLKKAKNTKTLKSYGYILDPSGGLLEVQKQHPVTKKRVPIWHIAIDTAYYYKKNDLEALIKCGFIINNDNQLEPLTNTVAFSDLPDAEITNDNNLKTSTLAKDEFLNPLYFFDLSNQEYIYENCLLSAIRYTKHTYLAAKKAYENNKNDEILEKKYIKSAMLHFIYKIKMPAPSSPRIPNTLEESYQNLLNLYIEEIEEKIKNPNLENLKILEKIADSFTKKENKYFHEDSFKSEKTEVTREGSKLEKRTKDIQNVILLISPNVLITQDRDYFDIFENNPFSMGIRSPQSSILNSPAQFFNSKKRKLDETEANFNLEHEPHKISRNKIVG